MVKPLPEQFDRRLSAIRFPSWHVQIVDKYNLINNWTDLKILDPVIDNLYNSETTLSTLPGDRFDCSGYVGNQDHQEKWNHHGINLYGLPKVQFI